MLREKSYRRQFLLSQAAGRGEPLGRIRRRLSGDEGATMVEFTLVFIVLMGVIFGIYQMCMAFYTYHYVSETAREGTRYAMVRGSSCVLLPDCQVTAAQLQTHLQYLGYPGINPTNMTVNTTWYSTPTITFPTWTACAGVCGTPGNLVKVQVIYAFPLGFTFWGTKSFNIASTSQMVIQQ